MFSLDQIFNPGGLSRYEPPPNRDKPTQRKPNYRGGVVCGVTIRSTPKVNRRIELKGRNAALRSWKKNAGIVGRVDSGVHSMFVALWKKSKQEKEDA